ncbi:MAG: hypothetical protein II625_09135 [Bacilli bacterium]|nr:hypothetical protein [Bacilli bacterium]
MKKINIEELEKVLDSCIKETIDKMEKDAKETKAVNDSTLFVFSLQNMLAMVEYKKLVKEKLGIEKER